MPQLNCTLPEGLWRLLDSESRATHDPMSHIVARALASYFHVPHHTLYQVSTSTALVRACIREPCALERCEIMAILASAPSRISTVRWRS